MAADFREGFDQREHAFTNVEIGDRILSPKESVRRLAWNYVSIGILNHGDSFGLGAEPRIFSSFLREKPFWHVEHLRYVHNARSGDPVGSALVLLNLLKRQGQRLCWLCLRQARFLRGRRMRDEK